MDRSAVAGEAVERALDALASHAGREHRRCDGCVQVAALLVEAQERIEEARGRSDLAWPRASA
jgi:hypothetical protein